MLGRAQAAESTDLGPDLLKQLSLEELFEQEITSVSKRSERLSGAAGSVQVITQEDIRRGGVTSIPEALRLASNLDVARVDSRQWAISARGLNNTLANKLLVLMDGRVLYTPLSAGVFWDVQDTLMEDVERIEVISGPGGSLWGANAVNGVINVITRGARDTQGLLVSGGGGSELNGFGGARYGGTISSNVFYRVYGKYFDRDATRAADGRQATNDWRMGQGGFRVDWESSDQQRFTVQGDYYDGTIAQPNAGSIEVEGGNVIGRWTRSFSEESQLSIQFYYDRTRRRIPFTFAQELDTYDLDLQHGFVVGDRHRLLWGVAYRLLEDEFRNSAALAFLPARVSRHYYSGFVQDEVSLIHDRLHFTLGSKCEHNYYTGFEVQPSARLAWTPTAAQTVWGAVSRAVRTPSRVDAELFAPGSPPFVLAGGEDFESEELLAYELGYRAQLHSRISVSVTGFYHDYDNIRSLEQVAPPAPIPVTLGNGLEARTYGVELAALYRLTHAWRLRASYRHLQVHFDTDSSSTDTSDGSAESNDSRHRFSLGSSVDLGGGWEADAHLRYISRLANPGLPSYGELDARLAWNPVQSLELAVVGRSLLHNHHPEFGPAANRNEIERAIFGKLTWRY